ncbi:hypothetical protein DKK78_01500 [Gilliamella apis]|uniref:Uncharacterized protein n=1 Tax=Gilliamella apis TaxID=1970738 RepID=A0A2V4DPU4_9GAMM|nr:hypothetical protein DKK78_01500 [Gilliamella apis]
MTILVLFLQTDILLPQGLFWHLFLNSSFFLRILLDVCLVEILWTFGILTLFLYSAHINIVNRINVISLIILMSIYSVIAYFISINTNIHLQTLSPFGQIFLSIIFAIIRYLLEALLLYYLIEFSKGYFVKSQNKFRLTEKNLSQIHYIVFSTFSCFILLKGYILESNAFTALFSGTLHNYLATIYLFAVLLGLIISKRNFKIFSDKIRYGKLVKSISISSIFILSVIFIVFSLIDNNPSKYYVDSFSAIFNSIHKLFLLLLLSSLICIILNITTQYHFNKTRIRDNKID